MKTSNKTNLQEILHIINFHLLCTKYMPGFIGEGLCRLPQIFSVTKILLFYLGNHLGPESDLNPALSACKVILSFFVDDALSKDGCSGWATQRAWEPAQLWGEALLEEHWEIQRSWILTLPQTVERFLKFNGQICAGEALNKPPSPRHTLKGNL